MTSAASFRRACLLSLLSCVSLWTEPAALAADKSWDAFRWRSIGLASSGWMRSIAVDPNDADTLWAVADMGGGIVYTTNGGRSWKDVMYNAIRDTRQASFLRVYVHPKGRVFVGYRSSFIYTDDRGETWHTTNARLEIDPAWMEFVPWRPRLVYAVNNLGTVFRSRDMGATWEVVFSEPQKEKLRQQRSFRVAGYFAKIRAVPGDGEPGVLLFRSHPHFGVTLSRDGGKTWVARNNGLPHKKVVSLDAFYDPQTKETLLFALVQAKLNAAGDGWTGGVYVSDDLGRTWRPRNQGIFTHVPPKYLPKHMPRFHSLEVSKKVRGLAYVLAGNVCDRLVAILRTEDAGRHWTCLHTNYVNVNTNGKPREICRLPYQNGIALAQSDPNIFYCMASSPMLRFEERGRVARQIEYEPIEFETGRYRWLGVSHVCTVGVAPDPFKPYVHTINHDVGYERVDLAAGVVDFRSVRHSPWSQGHGILTDPARPGYVLFGGCSRSAAEQNPKEGAVFKSTDYGRTFRSTRNRPESGLPSGFVFDLALDPRSPKANRRVYASIAGAGVFASDDAGDTWRSIHGNLPSVAKSPKGLNVQRLRVDGRGGLYAILYRGASLFHGGKPAGFSDCAVFYKPDDRSSWREVAGARNIGSVVFDIVSEPGAPRVLYAAAGAGVFKSEDAGRTWRRVLENTKANIKRGCAPFRLAIHPRKPNRVWVLFSGSSGYDDKWGVWVSDDRGARWRAVNEGLGFLRNTDLQLDWRDPDVAYVATLGVGVFRGAFGQKERPIEPADWNAPIPSIAASDRNLIANPSAEEVKDGKPVGWHLYAGACGGPVKWGSSPDGYNGTKCAFIEIPKMHVSTSSRHRGELYINIALVPADNDGYHARGALPAEPLTAYRLSFRIKGDAPRVNVRAVGWPSLEDADSQRQRLSTSLEIINPTSEWRRYEVVILTRSDTHCFTPTFGLLGYESEGFRPGQRVYVDDVALIRIGRIDRGDPPRPRGADSGRGFRWRSVGFGANGWMRSLAVDPRDPNTLWAVADMGAGINLTTNGGRSWTDLTYNAIRDTRCCAFGYVFVSPAGAAFVAGPHFLIRSTDRGKTWKRLDVDPGKYPVGMDFAPHDPRLMYLINFLGEVFRSRDGGDSWEKVFAEKNLPKLRNVREYRSKGFTCRIRIVPARNAAGYVLFRNHPYVGAFVSDDEGKTWRACAAGLPHHEVQAIDWGYDPMGRGALLYALLQARPSDRAPGWVGGVYVSADLGRTWRPRNRGLFTHVPPRFLARYLPSFCTLNAAKAARGLVFLLAKNLCDRSSVLLRTRDAGRTWRTVDTQYLGLDPDRKFTSISYRLPIKQPLALAPSAPDVFYGIVSAPILRFDRAGDVARQIEYEPLAPQRGENRYRWLGVSHVCVRGVAPDPQKPLVHAINHDVGYGRVNLRTGIVEVFRSKALRAQGKLWRQGNGILADPANPGVLYVGGCALSAWNRGVPKEGGIFKSTDYGQTFRSTLDRPDCGLPSGYVFTIQLDPRSPADARVLYTSIGGCGVFKSRDGGETWRSIQGNLPKPDPKTGVNNVPVLHVDSRGGVYAVVHATTGFYRWKRTRDRIFYSPAGDGRWREVGDTAPLGGAVFDLASEPGRPDTLYAAAFPGVFRSDDAGRTWRRVLENTDANLKAYCHPWRLAIHPKKPERVWVMFTSPLGCADKWGVWVSDDRGKTWREQNEGLCHMRLQCLALDPNDPDVAYVGTTGVGVFRGAPGQPRQVIRPAQWRDDRVLARRLPAGIESPRRVYAIYSPRKIAADGQFKEKVWARCRPATGFFGPAYPKKLVPEDQQTSFQVAYDDEQLAVRVRCRLPEPLRLPSRAAPAKHDGPAWRGEGVELFIETRHAGDFECVSQFIASCAGERADLRYFGGIGVIEWNAQPMWRAVCVLREREYEMLFLIPFKAIGMTCPRGKVAHPVMYVRPGAIAIGHEGTVVTLRLKVCRNPSHTTWTPVGYMSPLKDFGVMQFE